MNGAECLLQTLVLNGVNLCLTNPGTSELQFVSALDRVPGMRGVLCLFEGVCTGAADGYARMTGRPAATLLHLGPGLANGLAGLHNARRARSAVVNIVGQHTTGHLPYDPPLASDIGALARTVSSWVCVPEDAGRVGPVTSDAVRAALEPPGHIATLIVPADLSWSEAGTPGPMLAPPTRRMPAPERIAEAARILGGGESAGVLLGGSALLGRGLEAASRLATVTDGRIFTSRFFARAERGRNRFAPRRIPYSPQAANEALAGLRRLILVETGPPVSFFGYAGQRSVLAPAGCEFHELALVGENGQAALEALSAECGASLGRVATAKPPAPPSGTGLNPASLGQVFAALLPEGAIISDEAISAGQDIAASMGAAAPHDCLAVTGGATGQGLPVAVGAALACPDRRVFALQGDGAGMYTLQSLWTAAREQLDLVAVILVNRRYRILEIEMLRGERQPPGPVANSMVDIGHPEIDWVRLATGLGVPATRACTVDEFTSQLRIAVEERGPRLIEAVLSLA